MPVNYPAKTLNFTTTERVSEPYCFVPPPTSLRSVFLPLLVGGGVRRKEDGGGTKAYAKTPLLATRCRPLAKLKVKN